jgi:hypothetical protein
VDDGETDRPTLTLAWALLAAALFCGFVAMGILLLQLTLLAHRNGLVW